MSYSVFKLQRFPLEPAIMIKENKRFSECQNALCRVGINHPINFYIKKQAAFYLLSVLHFVSHINLHTSIQTKHSQYFYKSRCIVFLLFTFILSSKMHKSFIWYQTATPPKFVSYFITC